MNLKIEYREEYWGVRTTFSSELISSILQIKTKNEETQ